MRTLFFVSSFLLFILNTNAQSDDNCYSVNYLDTQSEIKVKDNLNAGCAMPLEWAQNSSVACFPGTRFIEFQGNHVLYSVEMPPASEMTITVSPKSKKHRVNLYALRLGVNNSAVPPEISSAISCEASYPIYIGQPNMRKAAKPQSVEYMSITKPYSIIIGVAGAKGVIEGEYELSIQISQK